MSVNAPCALTSTHFILCINICSSSQQQSHNFDTSPPRGHNKSSPSTLSPHPTITGINTMAMIALRKVHIVIDINSIHTNNTTHRQTHRQTEKRHTDISSTLTSTHIILCINICSSIQQQSHSFDTSPPIGPHKSSPSMLSPHPTITGINTMAMIALRKVHVVIDNNSIHTNNTTHRQI